MSDISSWSWACGCEVHRKLSLLVLNLPPLTHCIAAPDHLPNFAHDWNSRLIIAVFNCSHILSYWLYEGIFKMSARAFSFKCLYAWCKLACYAVQNFIVTPTHAHTLLIWFSTHSPFSNKLSPTILMSGYYIEDWVACGRSHGWSMRSQYTSSPIVTMAKSEWFFVQ